MNLVQELSLPLNPEFCWLLTMCLLHTLWQGLVVAFLVAVVVRLKISVHRRFATTFGLLVLIAALPICNYVWLTHSSTPPLSIKKATECFMADGGLALFELSELNQQAPISTQDFDEKDGLFGGLNSDSASNLTANRIVNVEAGAAVGKAATTLGWTVIGPAIITLLYLAGVFLMVLRLGWGLKSHWRLTSFCKRMKFAEQVPRSVIAAAEQAASSLGRTLRTPIALFYGEGAALVVGCIKPVILVNASLASGLTPVQLEQILAHELAHVYRFDPFTQLFQRLIESLLFFHPGVWYVSQTVSDLRELCCDEMATQYYSKVDFAETLLQCAVLNRANKSTTRYSLAATGGNASQLTSRIDALLHSRNEGELRDVIQWSRGRATRMVAMAMICVLMGLLVTFGMAGNSILPTSLMQNQQVDSQRSNSLVVIEGNDWQWITEEPKSIKSSQFLFGGKQLLVQDSIPEDIDVQAMVVEKFCKFTQWHFGDSNSTRVAILLEMDGIEINRLFVDRNRDRVIEDGEAITLKSQNDKTWLTSLEAEVHENGSIVRAKRQIGMTPNRDRSKLRITTLGFAEGKIEAEGKTYQARRVDKDGDGLPTGTKDQVWIDFNQDGKFETLTEQLKLGSILRINESRFMVRSDRLGQSLVLTPDDEVGFVQFCFELADKTATLETFEGSLRDESGMLIAVGLNEKPTTVPVGRYCLQDLVVQVRDKNSSVWRMTLSRGLDNDWSKVQSEEIIEVKQNEKLQMQLLKDLDFVFSSTHVDSSYSGHKTRLHPFIRTENGLMVTNFTMVKPNEKPTAFNQSVRAKFKSRDAEGTQVTDPEQCSSSFG
ncbi:MAG: M56 family metallopeptidase [Mariniblastus sp.]